MADADRPLELVASFFTLTGAGFAEPPRHGFVERCRAAAGRRVHRDRDARRRPAPHRRRPGSTSPACGPCWPRPGCGWSRSSSSAAGRSTGPTPGWSRRIEAVADAFGGRHVSAGEFRARPRPAGLDLDAAAAAAAARWPPGWTGAGCWSRWRRSRGRRCPRPATAVELLRRADAPQRRADDRRLALLQRRRPARSCSPACPPGAVAAVQLNDGPLVHDDFLRHARARAQAARRG